MRRAVVAALVLAVCAACGGPSAPVPAAEGGAASKSVAGRAQTIRMDVAAEPDVSDVPRLMVQEALQQAGYTIEPTSYSDNAIAIQAMTTGTLDVAIASLPVVLAAIQQGAAITVVLEAAILTRSLVTVPGVTTCADLNNRQVSVPNLVSSQTLAFDRFIAKRCPGTNVEKVVISGTNNRLAALMAHRTAGALLDLMTLIEAQRQGGPQFNVLSVFGNEFPGLGGAAVICSRAFLDRYPETARDIVREWIMATRRLQDPAVLRAWMEKHLGLAPDRADVIAKAYLARKVWDLNGGLPDGFMQRNIEFAEEMGVIKPGLTPARVEDARYVNAVLAEIGRK